MNIISKHNEDRKDIDPQFKVEKIEVKTDPDGVVYKAITKTEIVNVRDLKKEKETLLARVAEIDSQLQEITAL